VQRHLTEWATSRNGPPHVPAGTPGRASLPRRQKKLVVTRRRAG
jgi:hypothetical protein